MLKTSSGTVQRVLFWGVVSRSLQNDKQNIYNKMFRSGQESTVCILGALQRQVDLQGAFVKIGDFIKFQGFLVEFLENRRSWENQKPPENRQKSGLFWASPFTMHLVCTLLKEVRFGRPGPILGETLGTRMGPGRAGMAPTSGPGWVRSTVKQSTWRIRTGPLGTRDGTCTGPGSDPGDGTPRDSNRLLGLSEMCTF